MKKYIAVLLLSLSTLSLGTPAFADFTKGQKAFNNKDYATAVEEWRLSAEQGDAKSQFGLGWMYYNGKGVKKYFKTAVKWYTLAAKQGHVSSQYNLAKLYQNGQGVKKDYKAAGKWYDLAAEQGHAKAQYNLGLMV